MPSEWKWKKNLEFKVFMVIEILWPFHVFYVDVQAVVHLELVCIQRHILDRNLFCDKRFFLFQIK